MSHIDDASIEAYLDGAYEVLSQEELVEIERRLEDDAEFAARVAEARAIRDRAASILSLASPGDGDVPSFGELQRRAAMEGAGRDRGKRFLGLPPGVGLSWAATVVLALGVGWYVGQEAGSPAAGTRSATVSARPAAPEPEAQELAATADQTKVSEAESPEDVATGNVESAMAPPPTAEGAGGAAGAREARPEAFRADAVPERRRALDEAALADRREQPTVDADSGAAAETMETAELDGFRRQAATPPAGAARAMEAPTLGLSGDHALHSLALPALEVIGVNLDDAGALAGLEILHRLPTGDTLSLRYVGLFSQSDDGLRLGDPKRAEEEALPSVSAQIQRAALPAGWRQVVVRKENRWLIARAPLSEAEIRAYLMTLN